MDYADNEGEFCGVKIIPCETVWLRVGGRSIYKGRILFKKKGRFGMWQVKRRYWSIKWFGAIPNAR